MNRKIVCAFLLAALFFVSLMIGAHVARAASADHISFSSGVTLFSPLNKTYSSKFLTLDFAFAPGLGIQYSLTYAIDGQSGGAMPYVIKNPEELHVVYQGSGSVRLPELSEGSHSLTIYLEAPGITAHRSSYADTVYFFVDLTPPNVSILSPENKTYSPNSVPLNFTIDEQASNVTYCLDGNDTVEIAGNTTLTDLPVGGHSITVYAYDAAGHVGTGETVYFAVTMPEPTFPEPIESFPTSTEAVASAATIGISALGITVAYLKRHKH